AAELARVLALRLDLDDDTLAAAAAIPRDRLPDALRALRDAGMLVPGRERMIPAVAEVVLTEQPAAARRAVQDRIPRALLAAGTHPLQAAAQLRAARARTPLAAQAFATAAELLRWRDPAAAQEWLDDALDAGAEAADQAATRAEVAAQLGVPVEI